MSEHMFEGRRYQVYYEPRWQYYVAQKQLRGGQWRIIMRVSEESSAIAACEKDARSDAEAKAKRKMKA